jgi:hypothetical protein
LLLIILLFHLAFIGEIDVITYLVVRNPYAMYLVY